MDVELKKALVFAGFVFGLRVADAADDKSGNVILRVLTNLAEGETILPTAAEIRLKFPGVEKLDEIRRDTQMSDQGFAQAILAKIR